MNVDWPQLIVPGLAVVYLGSAYVHDHWHDLHNLLARAEVEEEALRQRLAPYIAQALNDEAEYLVRDQNQAMHMVSDQPCCHEDNWCNGECRGQGKHHALWSRPLDEQPAEVILAVVTDLKRRQK